MGLYIWLISLVAHPISHQNFLISVTEYPGELSDTFSFQRADISTQMQVVQCLLQSVWKELKLFCFQTVKFYGFLNSQSPSSSQRPKQRTTTNIICQKSKGDVRKYEIQVWDNVPLIVPPLPPSRLDGSTFIDTFYNFAVSKFIYLKHA